MRISFSIFLFLLLFSSCQNNSASDTVSASTEVKSTAPTNTADLSLFKSIPTEQSGLNFTNQITDNPQINYFVYDAMYQGAGVGVGDFNNDGLTDIYFAGNLVADKLFFNKGNMQFEDLTQKAGIQQDNSWSTGVAIADVNGDGWLDIYVNKFLYNDENLRRNKLYINNKNNTFTERAAEYGIADSGFSTQSNFFDYDKDGDLDLYVANQPPNAATLRAKLGNKKHYEFTDHLYRNEGNGKFTDVTNDAGLTNYSFSLSATVSDLNKDGWLDIYVGNDYEEPDFYYQNNGDGTFTNIADQALRHMSNFTMGCDIADFNNDGWPDIYTPDMVASDNLRLKSNMSGMNPEKFWALTKNGYHYQYMFNSLQMNNGNGTFSEVAQLAGTSNTDWSWSSLLTDVDNDGYKDLLVTNGLLRDMSNNDFRNQMKALIAQKKEEALRTGGSPALNAMDLLSHAPSQRIPNYIFRNKGDLTFQDRSDVWGFNFAGWTQGAAYADFDNDGDIDIVTNNMNDPASLYNNTLADQKTHNYLRIKLTGSGANPFAYGANATLFLSDGTQQIAEVSPVRGFFSCSESILHFGLANHGVVDRVLINWLDGRQSELQQVSVNKLLEINQGDAKNAPANASAPPAYFALQNNSPLPFRHTENAYDDYQREILLPYKLSHMGPKIATADLNGDQLDDLYITGASGQTGAMYLQRKDGSFTEINKSLFEPSAIAEETNALFFDADGDGDKDLFVVCGGNEYPENAYPYQDRLYLNEGAGQFKPAPLPKLTGSHSVVSAGDMDGDGDLDLFIGNRNIPGQYGHNGKSLLLKNDKGVFTIQPESLAPGLSDIGMVTDARWFDYDKDGKLDLAITGEWMPLTIFHNNVNTFTNNTDNLGLAKTTGWWNTLDLADIDHDGDLDVIAGNLGTNIKYKATEDRPFKLYVKDFDENGSNDVYLGYYDSDGVCYPVRGRQCSSQQMPFVTEEFKTYNAFANADIESVLGQRKEGAILKEATLFASTYFENKGDAFVARPLPTSVQMSPIYGIQHVDINKDGHLDLIVAGNFHEREVETTRSDAGIGQVLLGDGTGNFKTVAPTQSGLKAYKDVRDIKLLRGAGGNTMLVVGNNNDVVEVYRMIKGVEG